MLTKLQIYIKAARPATLAASVCPVVIGIIPALRQGLFELPIFIITLLSALAIQIITNFTNDYFDFVKGADKADRKGPIRVTQAGLLSLSQMKRLITSTLIASSILAFLLVYHGGWIIALIALISLILSFLYTAGPYPLAYLGLGELFVFLFFGPIATATTYYLQSGFWSVESFLIGIGPGSLSCAILTINNLRDLTEDKRANKKTLAVRLGKTFAKLEYLSALLIAFLSPLLIWNKHFYSFITIFLILPSIPLLRTIFGYRDPRELNLVLVKTGQLLLVYTGLFILGYFL
jgi:1,4-dihydroxy-2-naphthoate polyprenyltransferase